MAFGGGEPLGVPFCWDIFEILAEGGVRLKLETDASRIDDAAADRLAALRFDCIQISLDGATAETHEHMRPGHPASMRRSRPCGASWPAAFLPNGCSSRERRTSPRSSRLYDRAATIGRCQHRVRDRPDDAHPAAPPLRWDEIACSDAEWERAASELREHAKSVSNGPALAIYPWDIVTEIETRLESPQAMLLIVPNGKVKLLNALPFAPADLRMPDTS